MRPKTLKEAQALAELVAANKILREVWATPSIPAEQKRAVLDAIVKREGISVPVRNFLAVLMDHRRTSFLAAIVKQFELELDAAHGIRRSGNHQLPANWRKRARCAGKSGAGHGGKESPCALFAGHSLCWEARWSESAAPFMTARWKDSWRESERLLALSRLALGKEP